MKFVTFKLYVILIISLNLSLSQITIELKQRTRRTRETRNLQTNVPITKFEAGFYLPLTIGTPPQKFNIELDSGSQWLWVPKKGITSYYVNNTFDPTLSSTFQTSNSPNSFTYVDKANVNGIIATDTIVIAGSTIKNFIFTLATQDGKNFSPHSPQDSIDGLIGLSYNFNSTGCVCFVASLFQQGVIPSNMFAMNVGGNQPMQITLGGVNAQIVGNNQIYYYPVKPGSSSWDIIMTGMGSTVNSVTFSIPATIDSGTTSVIIPPNYQNTVVGFMPSGALSGCNLSNDQSLTCTCNSLSLPDIFFTFDKNPYIMKFADYVSSYSSPGASCNFDFQFKDVDAAFLMGVAFLKNYYNIYDYTNNRVGFVSQTYTITGTVPTSTASTPSTSGTLSGSGNSNGGNSTGSNSAFSFLRLWIIFAFIAFIF